MTTKRPVETHMRILRVAALLSLAGLALMMWSLVDPRPPPVLIGLSVGQAMGTLGFVMYLSVVVWDLRRRYKARPPPPDA